MTKIVVEDDVILGIARVILDPDVEPERRAAVADFFRHDLPDFDGWAKALRQRIPGLYPARVELADDEAELRQKIVDADAIIVERMKVGPEEIAPAKRLKLVQKWGGLVGNIDVNTCASRGIAVNATRRRINVTVAEQALTLMLVLGRRVRELANLVDAHSLAAKGFDVTPFDRRYTGNSNYARVKGIKGLIGSTLGSIGLGEIGREVVARARAFEMNVLYTQRTRLSPVEEHMLGATYAPLEELLATSDFVSIHVPISPATRSLLDARRLAMMKPGAILVNIARAEVVDHDALVDALRSGRLGGFGLDVGYKEPTPADEPLLKLPNVVILPHTGPADRHYALMDWEEMLIRMWEIMQGTRR